MMDNNMTSNTYLKEVNTPFHEEYQANAIFIENLRRQSSKIEQMIAQIQRLKSNNELKDKLIAQLKKKQSDMKLEKIKMQETLTESFLAKLKIAQLRIQQLETTKIELQNCMLVLKSNRNQDHNLKDIKYVHQEEVHRLREDNNELLKQLEKWKEKYANCKEQCKILRIQLEQQRKNSIELEHLLKQNMAKRELSKEEMEIKYKKVENELLKAKQEKLAVEVSYRKLQEYLCCIESQLASQISNYQTQIRNMMEQIARMEDNGAVWKERYCELEILVNHIETLRNNWRLNKLYSPKNKAESRITLGKDSKIQSPAQKDAIYEIPDYEEEISTLNTQDWKQKTMKRQKSQKIIS